MSLALGHSATALTGPNNHTMSTATTTTSHTNDLARRGSSSHSANNMALEDRFEVLKEIGDGSFGSVVLARVRSAGSNVARRGTVVSLIPEALKPSFDPPAGVSACRNQACDCRSPSNR